MSEENKAVAVDAAAKPEKIRKGDAKRERGNRTGFTTGACSAAAARAATLGLLQSEVPETVVCHLPNGQDVTFAVTDGSVRGNGRVGTRGDHQGCRR